MPWPPIEKDLRELHVLPNLVDYAKECAGFSWEEAERSLDGLPGGRGLNIAHEAVDRHAPGPRSSHVALRWISRHGELRDITYSELRAQTSRFANVLVRLGVAPGERVFSLTGRIP
jgi:acetyl-CoA synthetase